MQVSGEVVNLRETLTLRRVRVGGDIIVRVNPCCFVGESTRILECNNGFNGDRQRFAPRPPMDDFFTGMGGVRRHVYGVISLKWMCFRYVCWVYVCVARGRYFCVFVYGRMVYGFYFTCQGRRSL